MYNGDVPLGSNVIPILVDAQLILLNAQISWILAATEKLTCDFVVKTTRIYNIVLPEDV